MALLCSVWDDFKAWVTTGWSDVTFAIIVSILGVCGLLLLLSFFKQSFDKGKRPKWMKLILSLIVFGIMAVIVSARFA